MLALDGGTPVLSDGAVAPWPHITDDDRRAVLEAIDRATGPAQGGGHVASGRAGGVDHGGELGVHEAPVSDHSVKRVPAIRRCRR